MRRFKLLVQMDVAPEQEGVFNKVYDDEHVPLLMQVPGVVSVQRMRREETATISLGGEKQDFVFPEEPRFTAIYELEDAEVLQSTSWAEAVDAGSWASAVRPYTRNRRHTLHKVL
ncbi:DUF4286 family protein [uncultured Pelagimonas sp.]|uniref:DUF4286 family protein n=1 Tax=uncultured Pelagimonas sp. TaxID=1618102 RepID=UPI0026188DC8|nr:DUF4286 family protein [uncultured Pelagimonas sp.]